MPLIFSMTLLLLATRFRIWNHRTGFKWVAVRRESTTPSLSWVPAPVSVCALVGTEHGVTVIEGEGGHADFAPTNKEEALVLDVLSARFGRVSIERLLSGDGLLNIYGALMELERLSSGQSGGSVVADPSDVSALALAGGDPVAVRALTMFCNILGSVAGNLALTLGAKAGVYIAGGIPGKILSFLENSDIRARFEAKGRFQAYLQNIPLRVVIKEDLGCRAPHTFFQTGAHSQSA